MRTITLLALALVVAAERPSAQSYPNFWGDSLHEFITWHRGSAARAVVADGIEWERPGAAPEDELASGIRVLWGPVEVGRTEHGYRYFALQGRVSWAPEGEEPRPADWLQGMRVLIGRNAGERPDWSRGNSRDDTTGLHLVLAADGSFRGRWPCGYIRRVPGGSGDYQVGLAPATVEDGWMIWRERAAVLPGSVASVTIPGPRALGPALLRINAVGGWNVGDASPGELIRAVNHLHGLGREGALDALQRYFDLAGPFPGFEPRDPDNLDDADAISIHWIVRTLFEPVDPAAGYVSAGVGQLVNTPGEERHAPRYPIAIVEGVPFLVSTGITHAGLGPYPERQIAWAREHGKLREKPLVPTADPVVAAEQLLASLQEDNPESFLSYRSYIRDQVRNTLDHMVDPDVPRGRYQCSEAWWEAVSELSRTGKIRWSANQERFLRAD